MFRRACIDIGSNTTRLLVADCDADRQLAVMAQERVMNRIAAALGPDGTLPASKVSELVNIVVTQQRSALALGAQTIDCVATAGLRRAANRDAIAGLIAAACDGLTVQLLDGEQEAAYAFRGACWACPELGVSEPLAVVDVGGGSSELVVGTVADGVRWSRSVPIGSGDGVRLGLVDDPPSAAQLAQARAQITAALGGLKPPPVSRGLAVGGSAGALRSLFAGRLDGESIAALNGQLSEAPAAVAAVRMGLEVERVRMLPPALALLGAASELFGVGLSIGSGGLREGVLLAAGA